MYHALMPGGISKTKWHFARRLLHRRGRERSGALLVEGARAVESAIRRPDLISFLMIGPQASPRCISAVQTASAEGIEIYELTAAQADEISKTVSSQQLFAVMRWQAATRIEGELPAWLLHLSGIRDPRNMGPLLRTAAALGVTVSCSPDCVDVTHPETIRGSAAAFMDTHLAVDIPLGELQTQAADHTVVYAAAHGGTPLGDFTWPERTILVLGGEAAGATEGAAGAIAVTIPSRVESLNTAVAGAILMWDARRAGRLQVR